MLYEKKKNDTHLIKLTLWKITILSSEEQFTMATCTYIDKVKKNRSKQTLCII